MLPHGLKLVLVFLSWGLQGGAGQGLTATCVLPKATWHVLQSDLQLAATCAEPRGALAMPHCEPVPTATSVELRNTLGVTGGKARPDAAYLGCVNL